MQKDWTKLESSDSSESQSEQVEVHAPPPKAQVKKVQVKKEEEHPAKTHEGQRAKPKLDFLTDDELIELIQGKKRQGPQSLNVVYCYGYDQDWLREKFPMATSVKRYREGSFQVQFANMEDCLNFIRDKKQNQYRFRIKVPDDRNYRQPRDSNRDNRDTMRKDRPNYHNTGRQQRQQETEKQKHKEVREPRKPNLFSEQNRLFFDKKKMDLTAQAVMKEVKSRKMFDDFTNLIIVIGEEDKNVQKAAQQLAQAIAKELNFMTLQEKKGDYKTIKIKPIEKKVEPVKQAVVETKETPKQSTESYQYVKNKNWKQDHYNKDDRIISRNTILFKEDHLDKQKILNQIKHSKILQNYGNIRIKAFPKDLTKAKAFAEQLQKQLNCETVKEHAQDKYIYFALHAKRQRNTASKKKQYIEKNDNKVKVDADTNIEDAVLEIKDKWPILLTQFSGVKIQWETHKQKAQQLIAKLQKVMGLHIAKKVDGQVSRYTLEESKQTSSIKDHGPQAKDHHKEGGAHKPKQQKKKVGLIPLPQDNIVDIVEEIKPQLLFEEFKAKKQQLFNNFCGLRIRTTNEKLMQFAQQLGKQLAKRENLNYLQNKSKQDDVTKLEILIRKTKPETTSNPQNGDKDKKKKVDTSRINNYLDP